jgi:hypothetical protein
VQKLYTQPTGTQQVRRIIWTRPLDFRENGLFSAVTPSFVRRPSGREEGHFPWEDKAFHAIRPRFIPSELLRIDDIHGKPRFVKPRGKCPALSKEFCGFDERSSRTGSRSSRRYVGLPPGFGKVIAGSMPMVRRMGLRTLEIS